MSSRPNARNGFTLIELLVVLGIIAALMGMLIPAISIVRRKAREARAASEIHQIEAALASFRNVNASYPEVYGSPDDYAKSFLQANGTPKAYTGAGSSAVQNADWELIATDLNAQLGSVDRDLLGKIDITKDPWGHPYHYRPARYLPFAGTKPGAPLTAIDSEEPPNPDTFQLWSTGADGRDDGGQGDDIANWKKR